MKPFVSVGKIALPLSNRYCVDEVLPRVGVAMLYGPTQQKKSFVAVDLAGRIATGKPWAGRDVEQGRVCYLAAEDDDGIRVRLEAWAKRHGVAISAVDIALSPGPLDLMTERSVNQCIAQLDSVKPVRAVFIDTLSRSFGDGDDMSRADIYTAIGHAEQIAVTLQCLVVLIYHTARPVKLTRILNIMPKGGSPWEHGIGFLIACFEGELLVRKVKNGPDGYKLEVSSSPVDVGVDSKGRPVNSLVTEVLPHRAGARVASGTAASKQRPSKVKSRSVQLLGILHQLTCPLPPYQRFGRSPG